MAEVSHAAQPLEFLIVGLGLIGIAAAGITSRLFAAPPQEPISGRFAAYPWVEAIFMSGLFALVRVAALLFPLAVRQTQGRARSTRLPGCWGA